MALPWKILRRVLELVSRVHITFSYKLINSVYRLSIATKFRNTSVSIPDLGASTLIVYFEILKKRFPMEKNHTL
eukprot:snap_masked-scaffold_8-processed-gene-14.28-mRNA-1 protein AED:1.00 eAED:1.00 QI:0/0/0/0/1/1/4/0/73